MSKVISMLRDVLKAATLEDASFGFPNDRIEIKSVHFGDDCTGCIGDVVHPTDYIKRITEQYRRSWIIHPIQNAIDLLQWQPIETAPKDQDIRWINDGNEYARDILVWTCSSEVVRARWWQHRNKDGDIDASNFIADGGNACHPTHWMPLPEAPSE